MKLRHRRKIDSQKAFVRWVKSTTPYWALCLCKDGKFRMRQWISEKIPANFKMCLVKYDSPAPISIEDYLITTDTALPDSEAALLSVWHKDEHGFYHLKHQQEVNKHE